MGNRQLFPEKSPKELLADFKETGANAPFEEIVRRYAAMVYGVCLRVTGDKHDAEDATQAVFLSLALQAKTSREIKYIGPWLQKVAHRLALDVKKSKTRRKKREEKLADDTRHAMANGNGHSSNGGNGNGNGSHHPAFTGGNGHGLNPSDAPGNEELKSIMMEELNKLPAKYRMPLVMHYFGGLSREEMSEQLGCNPSTLGVRVHRGKAMLGTRLAKRGIAISAIAMTVLLEHVVRSAAMQPLMAGSSVAGASAGAAGATMYAGGIAGGAMSSATRVMALVRVVANAVAFAKLKSAIAIVLVVISFTLSTQASVRKFIHENLNLRIPLPSFDVSRWIKPLLQNFLPDLRADSNAAPTAAEIRPQNLPYLADRQPLALSRDWQSVVVPQQHSPFVAAAPALTSPAPKPNVTEVAQRAVELPQAPAEYSPLAKMILDPPSLRTTPSGYSLSAISSPSSLASRSEATRELVEAVKQLEQPLAVSTSGDLHLGALGGGGFGGKPQVYVLPANTTLRNSNVVIGDNGGHGLFRNLGGRHQIGDLTLARTKHSTGTYELRDGGTLTAKKEVIGDRGDGEFIHQKGVNVVDQTLIVGRFGAGRYVQSDGDVIVKNSFVPRTAPAGNDADTNAEPPLVDVDAVVSTDTPNGLHIGQMPGSTGQYNLDGGTLTATPQVIGGSGTGTFVQAGGQNSSNTVLIGAGYGGNGEYKLIGGQLVLVQPSTTVTSSFTDSFTGAAAGVVTTITGAPPTSGGTIRIGDNGYGTFTFGNAAGTGTVYSVGNANSVVVRGKPTGDGVIVGYGPFHLSGTLVNNSQIVADGFGRERTLDLSSFSKVTSYIENPAWGGAAGWFARREGKLLLPSIAVQQGTGTYNWGEDANDSLIDLVNSVRFKVHNAHQAGDVTIALLSPLRDDIPEMPDGHKFIGLWSFDASELDGVDGVDIQVRYDDAMAETLGLAEHALKLWEYNGATSTWNRLDGDPSFARDTLNHILSARLSPDAIYFAVSAPEPSGAVLVIAAGAAILRRRRRQ